MPFPLLPTIVIQKRVPVDARGADEAEQNAALLTLPGETIKIVVKSAVYFMLPPPPLPPPRPRELVLDHRHRESLRRRWDLREKKGFILVEVRNVRARWHTDINYVYVFLIFAINQLACDASVGSTAERITCNAK